jgi:chemotaxis methyl-accepting protein methylase
VPTTFQPISVSSSKWIGSVAAQSAVNAPRRPAAGARAWSTGCSTGEEPYSLALLAAEALGTAHPAIDVLATDISPTALAHAERGVYRECSLRLSPPERRGNTAVELAFDVPDI